MSKCQYKLELIGKESTLLNQLLMDLSYEDYSNFTADTLTVSLSNIDGKLKVPNVKQKLKLFIGTEKLIPKGEFTIDEITHRGFPNVVAVKARSVDFISQFKDKPGTDGKGINWKKKSIKDILTEITTKHNLKLKTDELADTIITRHQKEGNGQFLVALALDYNAICTIKDGTLIFINQQNTQNIINIDSSLIQGYSITQVKKDEYTGVQAKYYKNPTKIGLTQEGKSDRLKKLDTTYKNKKIASDIAKRHLKKAGQNKIKCSLNITSPNAKICAGSLVNLDLKPVTGLWQVDKISYSLNDSGLNASMDLLNAN